MVKSFEDEYVYESPWQLLTQAVFRKYPNPYASHVLTSDVVDRWVDEKGALHTIRLFLKTNSLPKWAKQFFPFNPESFIVEISSVDPSTREMRTRTWNVSHTKAMLVTEEQLLAVHSAYPNSTLVRTAATVVSNYGTDGTLGTTWLRNRIEQFGVTRLESNVNKSRKGMHFVLASLTLPNPSELVLSPRREREREALFQRLHSTAMDKTKKLANVVGNSGTHVPTGALGAAVANLGAMGAVGAAAAVALGAVAFALLRAAK